MAVSSVTCGNDYDGSTRAVAGEGFAAATLRRAAEATISVKSLRAEVSGEADGEGQAGRSVIDYQAPDRIRSLSQSSMGTTETLAIGATIYASVLGKPDYFIQLPASSGSDEAKIFLVVLKVVRDAKEVVRKGDEFLFTIPAGLFGEEAADGAARVVEGRITTLAFQHQHDDQRIGVLYRFSMFDSAPPVGPPPADRVVPYDLGLKPCGPDGSPPPGAIICDDSGRP